MKSEMVILGIMLGFWMTSTFAADHEQRQTIEDLYTECTSKDSIQSNYCIRYLEGAAGIMHAAAMIVNDSNTPYPARTALFVMAICSKTPISGAQLGDAFVKWADKNRSYWQRDDGFGAWAALQSAWPCQKPK